MSQDLSRSMQPSPEALMQGYSPSALHQQRQSYGHAYTHGGSPPPPVNLRPPTCLRNLAPLATPLATPTWMQNDTFQSPMRSHTHAKAAASSQWPDQSHGMPHSAAPRSNMRVPADNGVVPRYGTTEPSNTLAVPADTDAVPSEGLPVPNNILAGRWEGMQGHGHGDAGTAEAGTADQKQGSEEEEVLHMLTGNGVEEEVLEAELQALRAARQQFQRASLTQVRALLYML